jgi:hypothetical protein
MNHVSGAANRLHPDQALALRDALALDAGVHLPTPHRDARAYRGLSLLATHRILASARGEQPAVTNAAAWDREINAYRSASGLGTSTLPELTYNAAHVSLLAGWSEAPATWPHWCRTGRLETYLREQRVGASAFPALEAVPEGAEIPLAKRSSRREPIQAEKYAKILRLSREVALGDDPGWLLREMREHGRAARMAVERKAIALLTSNSGAGPTLTQDSVALFHSTHGNLAGSGAAPSVTTLQAACAAMRTRTDPTSGEVLNAVPRVLLVPAALESTARVLVNSWNSALGDAEGDMVVAVCPRLDAVSATAWYLTARPESFDTFEVAFLEGQAAPDVEEATRWSTDGVDYKVRLEFGVAALDFRGMYRNPGA